MIVGIGVDIVDVHRIQDIAERHKGFVEKIFAPEEIKYCQSYSNPFPHYAARFAAKEAVFKALGSGWSRGLKWSEIRVVSGVDRKPAIQLSGATNRLAESLGVQHIQVSLSHTGAVAIAQVTMEEGN